jgi:hypothetical protein
MRIRTGHGPKDWRDVGEGYAGSIPLRGSLVVGGPAKIGDKPLERTRQDPQNQGVKPTTLEVPAVSVVP